MTDLSDQAQFDIEANIAERVELLGALPRAPMAMPLQRLEMPRRVGLLAMLMHLRPASTSRVGH
ncbi:MAG: hypothetical protein CFE34_03565 [Rhodobacteraceae bacterium PARR1]|nr:MAG: hypothetical protein CFE34_03565 [Rhodobacteraceae bacterium PARR1]